ncbi:MAG: aldo/keto reductase family protein [Mycoplasmoidaceae bacterium]
MIKFLNSKIGYGTYKVTNQEELNNSIKWATLAKYDFIDTAAFYKNETQIGKAIRKFKKEFPKKEILPIQTKIFPNNFNKNIVSELKISLKKLGNLKSVEACLLHRPHVDNTMNVKAWKELIKCQKLGLVKYIGVSNFEPDMIRILYNETGIIPQIVQDEASVNSIRNDRIKFSKDNNIMMQGWRPMGLLEKNMKSQLLKKIAKKYKCDISDILIAFSVAKGYVPVVKSSNEKRIYANIKALKIKLKKEDVIELELNLNEHQSTISSGTDSYAFLSLKNKT